MSNLIFADCGCNEEGSANGNLCEQSSGQCTCKLERYGRTYSQGKLKLKIMIPNRTLSKADK